MGHMFTIRVSLHGALWGLRAAVHHGFSQEFRRLHTGPEFWNRRNAALLDDTGLELCH